MYTIHRPRTLGALRVGLALLAALVCLLAAGPARAADRGHGVAIWPQSSTEIVAQPGEVVSASFRVEWDGAGGDAFMEALDLPPGWQGITPPGRILLTAGEPQIRLVAFSVPSSAPAGTYTVKWRLSGQTFPDVQDEEILRVTVQRLARLSLMVEEVPSFVVAGETARVQLRVMNGGNAPARVALRAEAPPHVHTRLEPERPELPIRGDSEVILTVDTPRDTTRSEQYAIKVYARVIDEGGPVGEEVRTLVLLESVPSADTRPRLFRTLPTTLTLTGVWEAEQPAWQAEWRGAGFLDEDRTREFDFLLRGPDTTASTGIFGQRDEYRLRFQSPMWRAQLGDQSYRLSWLTDAAAYGRGAGLDFTGGIFDVGLYRVEPRFGQGDGAQSAAHVGVEVGRFGQVRVNGLVREEAVASGAVVLDGIFSGELRLTPFPGHLIHGEAARSGPLPDGEASGTAWRVEARGKFDGAGVVYNVQKVHATPGFTGYFQDTDVLRAMGTYNLSSELRLRAYYQQDRENLALDPAAGEAGVDRSIDLATTCVRPEGWCFDGGNRFKWSDDLLAEVPVEWEDVVSGRAVRSGAALRFNLQGAGGVERRPEVGVGGIVRVTALGQYEIAPKRTVSATARVSWASLDHGSLLDATRSLTFTGAWMAREVFVFGADYRLMGTDVLEHQINTRLGWDLSSRFRLQGEARWESARAGGAATFAAQLALSGKLGVPVARRDDAGAVKGRLVDESVAGEPGLPGVVVRVGGAVAITDDDGRFTIPALPPGDYRLYVDRQSLGPARMLTTAQGQAVAVRAGGVTRVNLAAVRGAEVRGEVLLVEEVAGTVHQQGSTLYLAGAVSSSRDDRIAVPGVLVELRRGDEVVRRITDPSGAFLIQGLTPGEWTLVVDPTSLPDQHTAVQPERQVVLEAGVEEAVMVAVRARMRRIQMIDVGPTSTLTVE